MTVATEKNRISNGKKPALVTKTESIPVLYSSLIISLKLIVTKNIYLLPSIVGFIFKLKSQLSGKLHPLYLTEGHTES